MPIKKITFALFLTFCTLIYAQEEAAEIDIQKYERIIFSIINDLDFIIGGNRNSQIVYDTFIISKNAILEKKVTMGIDPRPDTILGGLSFNIFESGEIGFVFGLKYLDTYYQGSSVHYSILIHEYRHLHDYLADAVWFKNAKNDFRESYWYEMDALRIEAEFIKYYLNGKYNLTLFEKFVLNSLDSDNLNTASIYLKKESWSYFWYFYDLENKYRENKIAKNEVFFELERIGNGLIGLFPDESGEEYIRFFRYIEISTFRKYLIRILPLLIDRPEMTWGEVFEQYPYIEKIYAEMSEIINAHNRDQVNYLNSMYRNWEDDILYGRLSY